jgi:hypothetical protein
LASKTSFEMGALGSFNPDKLVQPRRRQAPHHQGHQGPPFERKSGMTASVHPAAPHSLPSFIVGPGEPDILLIVVGALLVLSILVVGLLFLRLHTLPERMAHKSQKIQFEIVAVLGLLALFTHIHAFWVAALLLALIDLPDIGWPLRRMAGSLERIAGLAPGEGAIEVSDKAPPVGAPTSPPAAAADRTVLQLTPGETTGSDSTGPARESKRI